MAIDTTPSTVATSALQAIPFESLIGGPLDAAIKAQAMAAQTSWEFIQAVGLNPLDPVTNQRSAINVAFTYNSNGQTVQLNVPLLTIVPIPYIAINTINIDFKANISASASSVSSTSDSTDISAGGSGSATIGWGPFSATASFNANYSSKKDSKASQESKYSVEYTMDVAVAASQSDMPAGLAAVLNILQSSINATPSAGKFTITPVVAPLVTSAAAAYSTQVVVTIQDQNGLNVTGQSVQLDFANPPAWLGLSGNPYTVTTDSTGAATFTVAGTATTGYTPGPISFTITVLDAKNNPTGLTTTGSINFGGTAF